MSIVKQISVLVFAFLATMALAQQTDSVGAGSVVRYATDAYPGFDPEKDAIAPARKEPRWFSWFTGPKKDNPADQLKYCRELEADGNWSKAAKHYDALVRNWPTSGEAPVAQLRLAELLLDKLDEAEDSFAEYRYLVDFYSFKCDYNANVDRMYEIAGLMRLQGKTVVFFRFKNSVEVRHAYESLVLRAPGAAWAPDALLAIGELREDDCNDEEAVVVYENLRNLHYGSEQAKIGTYREAEVRMRLLRKHGYNRDRCRDTIGFLKLARDNVEPAMVTQIDAFVIEAESVFAEEAYAAARFYDSRTRTVRSAINAYERYLKDYPDSEHADEVRVRLEELKGSQSK